MTSPSLESAINQNVFKYYDLFYINGEEFAKTVRILPST